MSHHHAQAEAAIGALHAEGVAAFKQGKGESGCPYPYGSERSEFWWEGYLDARAGRA
jgi:ribosome modulation factor